ncbi:MAG: ice-binding family protein [Bacteroidota bacterium]|nr:ice-binding family protein [Bacteroidota bacterium]
MNIYTTNMLSRSTRFLVAMLTVVLMVPVASMSQYSNPASVVLGTAGNFRILAKTSITTTGVTTITGDIGISPGASTDMTGFGLIMDGSGTFSTSSIVVGNVYASNYVEPTPTNLTTAVANMETAYTNAAGRTLPDTVELGAGNITSKTLTHGLYKWTTGVQVDAAGVTISGSASDVWIFQIDGTLNVANGAIVTLSGGAQASNIFWQVAGQVTLGTTANMKGIILCQTAIVIQNGATLDGRALAQSAVTLDANAVLPVELVAFTATANRINADLHWSTATEVNNFGFEIQRSTVSAQSSDKNWSKTGFIEGNGTTNAPKKYSFSDNNLSSGKYFYRLKQIDRDGKFEYSKSVEVTIGQAVKEFGLVQNYPNPFNPSTQIQYSLQNASQVSLKVYNSLGVEVATLVNANQEAGSYNVSFNANNGVRSLSSGVYFYRLEAGSFVSTKKFILMK